MADCDNDRECEEITPGEITPKPLPKQCSGGGESGGTSDFNELDNRPKYGGVEMTGSTNIPNLSTTVEQLGTAVEGLGDDVDGIKGVIPEEATAENQLADKQYVDDAVAGGGGGGVKVLTSADYNYPVDNPTRIALWLLDEGQYVIGDGTTQLNIGVRNNDSMSTSNRYGVVVLHKAVGNERGEYIITAGSKSQTELISAVDVNGNNGSREQLVTPVIDRLTDANVNNKALSAGQGYVLDQKITPLSGSGAPTTATEGILGKIYIDTDTDTAYMCTKVDNGSYTWKQITA